MLRGRHVTERWGDKKRNRETQGEKEIEKPAMRQRKRYSGKAETAKDSRDREPTKRLQQRRKHAEPVGNLNGAALCPSGLEALGTGSPHPAPAL